VFCLAAIGFLSSVLGRSLCYGGREDSAVYLNASWRGNRLPHLGGSNMGFSHLEHGCFGGIKGCGMLEACCASAPKCPSGSGHLGGKVEGGCAASRVQGQELMHGCVLEVKHNQQ